MVRSEYPFQRYILALTALLLVVAVCVLILLITHAFDTDTLATVAVGASVEITLLIVLVMMVIFGRSLSTRIERMRAGDVIAHWQYQHGEWQRFADGVFGRLKRRIWIIRPTCSPLG